MCIYEKPSTGANCNAGRGPHLHLWHIADQSHHTHYLNPGRLLLPIITNITHNYKLLTGQLADATLIHQMDHYYVHYYHTFITHSHCLSFNYKLALQPEIKELQYTCILLCNVTSIRNSQLGLERCPIQKCYMCSRNVKYEQQLFHSKLWLRDYICFRRRWGWTKRLNLEFKIFFNQILIFHGLKMVLKHAIVCWTDQ